MKTDHIKQVRKYINEEYDSLQKSIVATPDELDHLQMFAKANQGSSDFLLMQMSINYGYKLALQNITNEIHSQKYYP